MKLYTIFLFIFGFGMKNRHYILFLTAVAYLLLQAHNFIPHNHLIAKAKTYVQTHGHEHAHESDEPLNTDESGDKNPFHQSNHSEEIGKTVYKSQHVKSIVPKPVLGVDFLAEFIFEQSLPYTGFKAHPPQNDSPPYLINLYRSIPLRAPPAFIAS